MKSRYTSFLLLSLLGLILSGCTGVPDGIQPVSGFQADRYLGKWYEIARLDHRFERGMDSVTAEYSMMDDGGISVTNRGFISDQGKWKEATGKAYFTGARDSGHLKVSFFGPFYGSYVIFGLDEQDYQYAFVTSYDRSYLWLLARQPRVSQSLIKEFKQRASELGYETDKLIFVKQDRHMPGNKPLSIAYGVQ